MGDLFCEKSTAPACAVTFWCGKQTDDPVTWDIKVELGEVLSYWPEKTNRGSRAADLEAVLGRRWQDDG